MSDKKRSWKEWWTEYYPLVFGEKKENRNWQEWWTEFYGLIFAWALIFGFVGSLYLAHFLGGK